MVTSLVVSVKVALKKLYFMWVHLLKPLNSTGEAMSYRSGWLVMLALSAMLTVPFASAGPLDDAAKENNLATVKRLIANGAKINEKGKDGLTALHWAAYNGNAIMAELLISKGAKLDLQADNGYTPLHWAAVRGGKAVAELLIRNGSDVNARDAYGNTPLSWARLTGHKDVAELLQSSGAQ